MRKASATKIVDLIFRDFKPADSNWIGDAWDMIGEAIEGIGYHIGFEKINETLTVANNRVKWPKRYTDIKHIKYNGFHLPLGGDLTTMAIADTTSQPTVEIDPYRLNDLKDLVQRWEDLEEAKEGSSPEDVLLIQAKQDELMKDITKLSGELIVNPPKDTSLGEYYQITDDYIYTSFPSGEIQIFGSTFSKDKDGIPYIIDTFKYREACFYRVCTRLIFQGYKHPVLDFATANQLWLDTRHQASNEARIMGLDKHDRFAKLWTRFKPDPYELSTGFKYVEQK